MVVEEEAAEAEARRGRPRVAVCYEHAESCIWAVACKPTFRRCARLGGRGLINEAAPRALLAVLAVL